MCWYLDVGERVRLDEVEVLDESSLRSRWGAGEALPGGGG